MMRVVDSFEYRKQFVGKPRRVQKLLKFCKSQKFEELAYRGKTLKRSPKVIFRRDESVGVYRFGQEKQAYGAGFVGPFPKVLERLVKKIEKEYDEHSINSAIIIKYSHGTEHHIPWHSDKQEGVSGAGAKDMVAGSTFYNVMVYEGKRNRHFQLANVSDLPETSSTGHETPASYQFNKRTRNGAMVVITAEGNKRMKHRVPKEKGWEGERYSIVFRCIKSRGVPPLYPLLKKAHTKGE